MASQEPPEAAGASNGEQPSPAPNQVKPQQDGSGRVFRLLFRGEIVFEHRNISVPCHAASSSSPSSSLRSSSGDNCRHPPPRPVVPDWVMALATTCRGEERVGGEGPVVGVAAEQPQFLMTKKITKTDLNIDENRLLVPAAFVNSNIVPLLRDDEKTAASLNEYPNKKRKRSREESQQSAPAPPSSPLPEVEGEGREVPPHSMSKKSRKTMEVGRPHGGLQVTAWTRSMWHFDGLRLTCWDRNNATVLKGEHLKYLYDRSFLSEGDQVELWGFRDVRGQLHIALHKSSS